MSFTDYFTEKYHLGIGNDQIERARKKLKKAIKKGTPIYVMGNGGSAYTANHFSQDLVKACLANSMSLSENTGLITAIANDISYDDVFAMQLITKPYGICVFISCSGNSKNILNAAEYAYDCGWLTISLTGNDGGELKKYSDIHINVPTNNIFVSESIHSIILHYLIDELKIE
jgi:D-sedoheptulose 7-phosphate isomerase